MLLSFGPVIPNARIFFPRKLSKIHGKFCMNEQLVVLLIMKNGKGILIHESAVIYPLCVHFILFLKLSSGRSGKILAAPQERGLFQQR